MTDTLWTVQDVAEYLKVSRAMVYRLRIRFSRIGSHRRYDPADVRQYVELASSRPVLKKVS